MHFGRRGDGTMEFTVRNVGNGTGVSIRAKHRRDDPTPVVVKDSSASALVG